MKTISIIIFLVLASSALASLNGFDNSNQSGSSNSNQSLSNGFNNSEPSPLEKLNKKLDNDRQQDYYNHEIHDR